MLELETPPPPPLLSAPEILSNKTNLFFDDSDGIICRTTAANFVHNCLNVKSGLLMIPIWTCTKVIEHFYVNKPVTFSSPQSEVT